MSSKDPDALPQGLANTLRAGQDAQRRRAQAHLSLEIYRAANNRPGSGDRQRPGPSVQAKSSRAPGDS
ncbi:MAG: hypothetical protein G4V63_29560 [Candidatus Afipia apatlaquensis]|uniref:Uncharacterized protein n=1 Tax=Candidatus Afipia apatlaquensis TaxID=2712852 RepID=A0A7C9VQE2_9BRAD|nr:hypothetical protein [Candidatus Afipia apatlaquensis]